MERKVFYGLALCICLGLLLGLIGNVHGEVTKDKNPYKWDTTIRTKREMKKLPVDHLRQILKDRGVKCKGCRKKSELVEFAFQSQTLPLIKNKPREVEQPDEGPKFQKINVDDPNYEVMIERMQDKEKLKRHAKIIQQLRDQGFDTSAVEKPKDDLNDLMRQSRQIKEERQRVQDEKDQAMREERRRRREERKRKAEEQAKKLREAREKMKKQQEEEEEDVHQEL